MAMVRNVLRMVLLTACLMVCGCGEAEPEPLAVQPVSGTVKRTDGTLLSSGIIELRLQDREDVVVNAVIDKGIFQPVSYNTAGGFEGVLPGRYEVWVTPAPEDPGSTATPVTLGEPITIEPGQTEIEITLP